MLRSSFFRADWARSNWPSVVPSLRRVRQGIFKALSVVFRKALFVRSFAYLQDIILPGYRPNETGRKVALALNAAKASSVAHFL